jgi:hypothetical protein
MGTKANKRDRHRRLHRKEVQFGDAEMKIIRRVQRDVGLNTTAGFIRACTLQYAIAMKVNQATQKHLQGRNACQ